MRRVGVGDLKISSRAKALVNEVLDSNRLTYGPVSKEFEREVAREHSCAHAIFCCSGTAALHMSLSALKEKHGWADGDEVLVPGVTFISTANAVVHCGLKPVIIDVHPDTLNIDCESLSRPKGLKLRAVIPVHMHGAPADMTVVLKFANNCGLKVVEDSCEAWFTRWRSQPVCSFGDVGCLSTFVAHTITGGIGGFSLTNDDELASIMRSYMVHGQDFDQALDPFGGREFIRLGHNFRCTEMEAAIGLAQFEVKDKLLERRALIVNALTSRLEFVEELELPHYARRHGVVYMVYPMICKSGDRDELRKHLQSRGIGSRKIWTLPGSLDYRGEVPLPVTERVAKCGFMVGCHPYLSMSDVDRIVHAIKEFYHHA